MKTKAAKGRKVGRSVSGGLAESLAYKLMDIMDDCVLLLNSDLTILRANRYSTLFTGYTEDELEGESLIVILDSKERRRMYRTVREMKMSSGGQTVIRTRSRMPQRVEFSISLLADAGVDRGGYLFVGKPAERKIGSAAGDETSGLMKKILENRAEPMFIVDSKTRLIIACNQCAADFSGYETYGVIGRTMFEFLLFDEEKDAGILPKSFISDAYAKKGIYQGRVRFIGKNGGLIPCDCYSIPFFKDDGRYDYTIVVLVDRSEIERRRMALADLARSAGRFATELAELAESPDGQPEGLRLSDLGFTPRQVEIARLVFEGCPSKEIGFKLGIAESTVKNHLATMFRKIGASSRVDFLHKLIEQRVWIA